MSGQVAGRSRMAAFVAGVAVTFVGFILIALLSLAAPFQWAIPAGLLVGAWYYRRRAMVGLLGFSPRRTSNIGWWTAGFATFFALIGSAPTPPPAADQNLVTAKSSINETIQNEKEKAETQRERMREYPEEYVELEKINWSADFSIMELSVTLKNNSEFALKDFVIECEHSAASGTVIDRNKREIFEIVGPGASKRIRNFNMGFIDSQAKSTACLITRAKLV